MIKICYGEAIKNQNITVVLENNSLSKIKTKDKKDKGLLNTINKKDPVNFIKANKLTHKLLNEIDYIEFWSNTNIYKIKEER